LTNRSFFQRPHRGLFFFAAHAIAVLRLPLLRACVSI
jgi:hypothetical protein